MWGDYSSSSFDQADVQLAAPKLMFDVLTVDHALISALRVLFFVL